MKVRTSVLVVCMTVVPALAMFSHHVPAGLRDAARRHLWEPVVAWLRPAEDAVAALPEPPPPTADQATATSPTSEPPAQVAAAAPLPVAAGEPPATVAPSAADRLAALGAVAVEVRPLEGVAGMHVASCRVAMDAAGQLHRVFQAPGPDPAAATAALAGQVAAWRERMASRAAAPAPAGSL